MRRANSETRAQIFQIYFFSACFLDNFKCPENEFRVWIKRIFVVRSAAQASAETALFGIFCASEKMDVFAFRKARSARRFAENVRRANAEIKRAVETRIFRFDNLPAQIVVV